MNYVFYIRTAAGTLNASAAPLFLLPLLRSPKHCANSRIPSRIGFCVGFGA
ncbi:MAG: hypothetical protein MR469_01460 [Campylobacter sp.]|uniref:hypothetical protein n=1 Tax=Campylobacter sp. TaxID=205 RepID=UPI002AA8A05D|nr:hypothetical protein [Campylobacter sp.]MCI6694297.1 hypothetical protein [Campylobacter sp.]